MPILLKGCFNSLGENETRVVIQTVRLLLTLQRYIHSSSGCTLVKAWVNLSNVIDISGHRTMKLEQTSCSHVYVFTRHA